MTPEKLVEALKQDSADELRSVILYGSAATDDYIEKKSDYNVLVVTQTLGIQTLKAFSKAAVAWEKAGNPAPLLFTEERLAQATDVFPIELLDIYECHRVLYGENVVENLTIDPRNLRLQIEHELRGNLIKLRQRYLLTQGKNRAVIDLMTGSLSTFMVLFRATLRLFEKTVPMQKIVATELLASHLPFDVTIFKEIQHLRDGTKSEKGLEIDPLFENYLKTIECVIDAVDAHLDYKGE